MIKKRLRVTFGRDIKNKSLISHISNDYSINHLNDSKFLSDSKKLKKILKVQNVLRSMRLSDRYYRLTIEEIITLRKHLRFKNEDIEFYWCKKKFCLDIIDEEQTEFICEGASYCYIKVVLLKELEDILKNNLDILAGDESGWEQFGFSRM